MTRLTLSIAAVGATLLAACAEPAAESATTGDPLPPSHLVSYTVIDFSSGPADDSYAYDINDKKVVVGWTNIMGGGTHAWVASTARPGPRTRGNCTSSAKLSCSFATPASASAKLSLSSVTWSEALKSAKARCSAARWVGS